MTMLLRRGGGAWREPATDRYEDEADLQRVLADSPSLVPGVGPAVTVAEFPLDGGSVDVVVVEPSGDVTLVECKLAKNPEVRRAVVGQTLSYAARVAKLSVEEFSERFCRRSGGTLHDRMRACIEADPSAGVEWDPQAFDAALAERLARGPLRVVVAVDTVNEELRDIVEFLNLRTTGGLEVLALELELARDGDVEVLMPRVFGEESARTAAGAARRTSRTRWSVEDTFDGLGERVDAACVAQVRRLVDGIVARGARLVPGSGAAPSFFAYGPLGATNRSLFGFTLEESRIGAPSIYFSVESWSRSLTEDELGRLVERLDRSPEMGWLGEAIATRGAKALHRVRIDEVMRGPELVDALLEGLGAFMAPVG
jgi:hypothetical protein